MTERTTLWGEWLRPPSVVAGQAHAADWLIDGLSAASFRLWGSLGQVGWDCETRCRLMRGPLGGDVLYLWSTIISLKIRKG